MTLVTHMIAAATLVVACFTANVFAHGGDDVKTLLAEARASASAGRTNDAIAVYKRIVAKQPDDSLSRCELARLLVRRTETRNEAEKYYAEAVALAANDPKIAVERAANLSALGDNVNAALEFRRAFELSPNDDGALNGYLAQINLLGATPVAIQRAREGLAETAANVATRIMLAALLQSEGQYDDAIDQYSIARNAAPDNFVAMRGIAESWLSLGYVSSAEELFAILANNESPGSALSDRARVFLAIGQPEEAVMLLSSKASEISSETDALLALADAYHELNQTTNERALLEKLASAMPEFGDATTNHVAVLQRLARARFQMGDLKGTSLTCDRLLNLAPGNPVGVLGLELAGGKPAVQIDPVKEGIPANRQFGNLRAAAKAAIFWNQPEKALTSLRLALRLRSDSPMLLMDLGNTLLKTGDAENAAATFAQIAISKGQRPDAILGMADAERARSNFQRALNLYNFALQKINQNARALAGQAEAFLKLGESERAAVVFGNLTRRYPNTLRYKDRFQEVLTTLGRTYRMYTTTPAVRRPSDMNKPLARLQAYQNAVIEPVLTSGDSLRIRVTGYPELSSEAVVDDDSMIRLPYLESAIQVGCLTEHELITRIVSLGGARFAGKKLEIEILEYQRLSLAVGGAVYLPGNFNVRKPLSLHEALMLASGTTQSAGNVVYVVRRNAKCEGQTRILDAVESYNRLAVETGKIELAEPLRAGDTVLVTDKKTAFVVGDNSGSGIVETSPGLTLLDAVQRIVGILNVNQRAGIRLHRLRPDGITRQTFNVNLDSIEQKNEGNIILLPEDVVEIPSSNGSERPDSLAALVNRAARSDQSQRTIAKPVASSAAEQPRLVKSGAKP